MSIGRASCASCEHAGEHHQKSIWCGKSNVLDYPIQPSSRALLTAASRTWTRS